MCSARLTKNIKRIEQTYGVKITNRGTELKISGEGRGGGPRRPCHRGPAPAGRKGRDDRRAEGALSDRPCFQRERGQDRRNGEGRRLHHSKGPSCQGKDPWTAALYEGHFEKYHHDRRRSGWYRQDIPRRGGCRGGLPREGSQPHHPDAPRCRGGRTARVPARRPAEQGRPVSAPAV